MESSVILFASSIFIWYLLKKPPGICAERWLPVVPDQPMPKNSKKPANNPEADYTKETALFGKLFLLHGDTNLNIHPDLYREKSFKNNHDQDWCIVENAWKSRILFQNTVQGNVIMYYDIYKQAFVYYSDMQVSYKWLNYCAMRYVRLYFCRDFFVDDSFLPAGFVNPFNQNKIDGEKKELEKKEKKRGLMSIDFKSDVFLQKKKKIEAAAVVVVVVEKFVNNFRYMGKLNNYSFLQVPKKEEKICENYQYIDFKLKQKQKQEQSKKQSSSSSSSSSLYGWI
jgi:hypothetical protein